MNDSPKSPGHKLGVLAWLLGSVAVIWTTSWFLCLILISGEQAPERRGQFGDMFGAVNSLFSAFAFAGLIYTVLLQREELSLQRAELQDTRQELKRSADAQAQTEMTYRKTLAVQTLTSQLESLIQIINWRTLYLDSTHRRPSRDSWSSINLRQLCEIRDERANSRQQNPSGFSTSDYDNAIVELIELKAKAEEVFQEINRFSRLQMDVLQSAYFDEVSKNDAAS